MSSFFTPGFIDSGGSSGIPQDLTDSSAYQWLQSYYNRRLEPLSSINGDFMFAISGDVMMDWTQPNAS